jgi:hypothetical protein
MRRARGPTRLADLLPGAVGPVAAQRGFAATELIARWQDIAGPEIGPRTRPLRLAWPPRGEATDTAQTPTAVLHLKVESAFAMALHFEAPRLIERINAHLGWRCVGEVRLRQGPVGGAASEGPAPLPPPSREQSERLSAAVAQADDALAASLRRFGEAVMGSRIRRDR